MTELPKIDYFVKPKGSEPYANLWDYWEVLEKMERCDMGR